MSPQTNHPAKRPVPVALCLMALTFAIALIAAANANAAHYKMLACAGGSGTLPYTTNTNTASPQNPAGIFSFENHCFPAPDPAGESAFLRIAETQGGGNAGVGAYGNMVFDTPPFVHFKAANTWTRQPYSFNEGWRSRIWVAGACCTAQMLIQGVGLPNNGWEWGTTGPFALHPWPAPYYDFTRYVFEMQCVRPQGCDRTNLNLTDANTFLFVLSDESAPQIGFTDTGSTLMQGGWVRGSQSVNFSFSELGSGVRVERMRVDGAQRWEWDHWPECSGAIGTSAASGEWARTYQPCPAGGPFGRAVPLDTAGLADGVHAVQVCAQDYGQYQGLDNTGGQSCADRTIRTDNSAPGAPSGFVVTSANPNRYLSRFGAQFSLPPNQGSPIARVHYDVVNATGTVVMPEKVVSGTNPTSLAGIEGPSQAGDYRLRVWLEDEVGFSGPAATAPIPRDTTPPAAPQAVAVTTPTTSRAADGFDLRWHNIIDNGSPIDSARYQVLDGAGKVAVLTTTAVGDNVQAIANLDVPSAAGSYQLRLWLTDAEGNAGAPVTAPLAYECVRSSVSGGQHLSAALGGQGNLTLQQGQGTSLTGTLGGQGGPVATAPVCVYSRVVTDAGKDFLGIALTDPAGGYRFPIPAGSSRELSAVYRPDQRQLRAAAMLRTVVHPTLRARKTVVRNGESAYFEGEIPGPHNDNVTIVLQVKSGNGWLAFRRYRTRNDGHYEAEYPFRRTTRPTNYEMRAQVRESGGFPYEEGDSDPVVLRVVPGKPKPVKKAAGKHRCQKQVRAAQRRGAKRCHAKKRGAAHKSAGR